MHPGSHGVNPCSDSVFKSDAMIFVIMATDESRLDGLRVLIMGASDSLALAIAQPLTSSGAALALTTATPEPDQAFSLQRVAKRISTPGHQVLTESVDMANGSNVQIAIRKQVKDLNGLDLLIAAPQFHLPVRAERMSDAEWSKVVNTNLSGVFYACRGAAREMAKNDPEGGAIIVVTAPSGENIAADESAYWAARAGVEALTLSLAREWRDRNIRVNLVALATDAAESRLTATTAATVLNVVVDSATTGLIFSPEIE